MTPIQTAVEPLRADAIRKARDFARQHAERVLMQMEEVGMDLDVYAPAPRGTMGREAYVAAQAKRDVATKLTTYSKPTRMHGEPNIRLHSQTNVDWFVTEAGKDASAQYDAFIAKLEAKVGAHSAAELYGSHVWGFSILTVTTPNGVQR